MSQEITEAPAKLPFVDLSSNGKDAGSPGRAWLRWLSSIGDALAGNWGVTSTEPSLPIGYAGSLASYSVVEIGRLCYVNIRITGAGISAPSAIGNLPKSLEKSILDVVLLDGSGSLVALGVAVLNAGVATPSASGTANEILVKGIYRTR